MATGLDEIKAALQNIELASEKTKEYLEKLENTPLNIAVTGESRTGKSSLVNALRGLDNRHKDAAPTGSEETTVEPTPYTHPGHPNITIWDLPGIGSTKFTADKYLECIEFEKYDFFIIVSCDRFKENDAKLAKEIQKMKKNFYFVRSKIDHDMKDEAEDQEDFDEEQTLKRIRDYCNKELEDLGIESPEVFLVSTVEPSLYDFEALSHAISLYVITMDITELDENKAALQNDDQSSAAEYLQKLEETLLNIAITGESGSGKSSFVNALRGLDNRHKDAAPTGCVETTMEVKEYPHPDLPNVKISDLPGIGSTKFTADKYLEHVEFEKYDFFIIVSSERFRENDAKLAKEIQKMEKKFYFVRSKIDDNMRAETRSQRNFDEEKSLKQIRDDCNKKLQELGMESPQVFLVSRFELHLYDFEEMCQTFQRDLLEHKREVLLHSLPVSSLKVIDKKIESLKKSIKYYALASATIPNVSNRTDFIVQFINKCQASLGLTDDALCRLSQASGVSIEDLKSELQSPLTEVKGTTGVITSVLQGSMTMLGYVGLKQGSKLIPFLGIPGAMGLSCLQIYPSLKHLLQTLGEDAHRVFTRAWA